MAGYATKFILFSLLICTFTSMSQSPYFSPLKIDRSVQQFETNVVFQDSKGYIWFATSEGLYIYDGFETQKFGPADSLMLSPVTAIGEDGDGLVWVGHKNGKIEIFNGQNFVDFSPEEGLPIKEITFFLFDKNRTLWFGSLGEGVYCFTGSNRKRLYNLSSDDGLNDDYTYSAVQCPLGNIYVGTDNGIAVIDTASRTVLQTITMRDGLPDNIVRNLIIRDQTLWIGMDEGGIARYNIFEKTFLTPLSWDYGRISGLTLRNNNECWVSTRNNGVVKILFEDEGSFRVKPFGINHGLLSSKSSAIFSDRERNIWFGNSLAIVKTSASPFEFFDSRDGFVHKVLFSFINDKNGNYWAATQTGLIRIYENNAGEYDSKTFSPPKGVASSSFISLYQDATGYIWAGTYGYGVFRINPNNLNYKHYTINNGLPDNNIMHITGKDDLIWLSTLGGGVTSFSITSESFTNYSIDNGLGSNYVYSTFVDSLGKIYVALDGGGVSVIQNNVVTTQFIHDSLGLKTVYAVSLDRKGSLWINSAEKGLCMIGKKGFVEYSKLSDYKIINLRSFIQDTWGNMLLIGNEAIQVYDPEKETFDTFAEESGVTFLDPNLNAVSVDISGNIWISTNNGLVVYNPRVTKFQTEVPKVIISKRMLFFDPIPEGKNRFSFRQNHISFEFAGFWFQAPENIRYRYKLHNYDFDWNKPTQSRNVTYSNLPPGKYTFLLEVSHKPGVWTAGEHSSYTFSIKPPFYKTWWFISLVVLVIGSSIVIYVKNRLAKLQKDKERLENEVIKRTATIQHQKEEIETQRDYVIKQRDQIAKQNKDITSSIQYASRIQSALYPPLEQMRSILGECFILLRPQEIVSGDFYWATQKDNNTLLAVADCTGHGVPGAFMSVLGISLLNKIVNEASCCKPEEVLNKLRDEVKESLRQTGKMDEAKDGMDMALIQFNRERLELHFAGANNPAIIIKDDELIVLKENRMPIGIYPKEKEFEGQTVKLKKNDMIYLFSDGYIDQLGGPNYRKFMMKNFKQTLLNISKLPLWEQQQILNTTMNEWKGESHQNDDILVVGVRV